MKKTPRIHSLLILALLITLASCTSAFATAIFPWSGASIVGEREDFFPAGWASFEVSGFTLTIILTNTTSDTILATGEVLTGLVWDINFSSIITLKPRSKEGAMMLNSILVGANAPPDPQPQDLSSEWAFKSDVDAGSGPRGPLGKFGIGTMGDINFGADSFGKHDRFDTSTNLFGPDGLNGVETGILGSNVDLDSDGFKNNGGPLVQGNPGGGGKMIFTFDITEGSLQEEHIENVQPLFGTDGAPLTPEPGTLLLVASGLAGLAGYARLRFRRKQE